MNRFSPDSLNIKTEGLKQVRLRVIDVPQKMVFKSAIGIRKSRKALIVELESTTGNIGYGECSCRPDPYYSHEFVDGAVLVLKEFIVPKLRQQATYSDLLNIHSHIRGWNFTKAAIEFAYNDLVRIETGKDLISHFYDTGIEKVPVGISLGIFTSAEELAEKANAALEEGYQRVKFKISPDYASEEILSALRDLSEFNVSLDANGSFSYDDFDRLEKFAELGYIIEQPFGPGAEYLHKKYKDQKRTPMLICLDEEVESYGNLLSYDLKIDQVNIKPGRIGGLFESLRMIDYCQEAGLDAWIGGMFETGIGRAQNLRIAALLANAKAHDLSPSSRYFERDVLKEPIVMDNGFIAKTSFENVEVDIDTLEELTQEINIIDIL